MPRPPAYLSAGCFQCNRGSGMTRSASQRSQRSADRSATFCPPSRICVVRLADTKLTSVGLTPLALPYSTSCRLTSTTRRYAILPTLQSSCQGALRVTLYHSTAIYSVYPSKLPALWTGLKEKTHPENLAMSLSEKFCNTWVI